MNQRSGVAQGHEGYFHEAAFYGSDDEFVDIVAPFLLDGVAAGEPTISILGEKTTSLIRAAIGDPDGLTYLSSATQYVRPATTIAAYRELLADLVARAVSQVRVAGEVPHVGPGAPWESWCRYEAAANEAFENFPLWGLCPYDTRTAPASVLAEVARTHPHVIDVQGGHRHNAAFEAPADFLARRLRNARLVRDPIEASTPSVALVDPTPATARHAVTELAIATGLDEQRVDNLVIAVSEVVTNAHLHGASPTSCKVWRGDRRLVVTVSDRGDGPSDPLIGLMKRNSDLGGGFGLWLAHQLCDDVRLGLDETGSFVVRLTVGSATHP